MAHTVSVKYELNSRGMTWVVVLLGLAGICLIVLMVKRIEGFSSCGCVDECSCNNEEDEDNEEDEEEEDDDETVSKKKATSRTVKRTGKNKKTGTVTNRTGNVRKTKAASNCLVPAPNINKALGPPLTFADYILHTSSDIAGSDIACFNDGRDATTCKTLCDADPACQAFTSIKGVDGSNVGCCYKNSNATIMPHIGQAVVNLYTKTTKVCDWITAANTDTWHKLSPNIVQVSIGNDGTLVGVDAYYGAFSSNNITNPFTTINGSLTQIDTKGGIIVGSETNGATLWRYNGSGSWTKMQGTGIWISVGADEDMWCIGPDQSIYHMVQGSWRKTPGSAIQVSVGDAANVWICNGYAVYKWQGSNWTYVPTPIQVKQVAVSAGGKQVVAVGIDGNIYGWTGATWTQISGNFNSTVTINDSYVIASNNAQSGDYAGSYYKSLTMC